MNDVSDIDFDSLQKHLGIEIRDKNYFIQALTHSSYHQEKKTEWPSNERLEFLGDSIIGFFVSNVLYSKSTLLSEGELAVIKSYLVSSQKLSEIAREKSLGCYILLSRGEELSGARERVSILADLYESIVAAIYLDSGFEYIFSILDAHFADALENIPVSAKNSKSMLQEKTQLHCRLRPKYVIKKESGPSHNKTFFVEVFLDDTLLAEACGKTKKEAELSAAAAALERFDEIFPVRTQG